MKSTVLLGLAVVVLLLLLLYFNHSDPALTRNYYYNQEFGLYIRGANECRNTRFATVDSIDWNATHLVVKNASGLFLLDMNKDTCSAKAGEVVVGPLSPSEAASRYRQTIHLRAVDELIAE
ncbi:MAG: hypothetical protein ICV83_05750 [Cytophagales bacterium]|nr:hypothetical protein [Cytophagales bacterium]